MKEKPSVAYFDPENDECKYVNILLETVFIEFSLRYDFWRDTKDLFLTNVLRDKGKYHILLTGPDAADHKKAIAMISISEGDFHDESKLHRILPGLVMDYLSDIHRVIGSEGEGWKQGLVA